MEDEDKMKRRNWMQIKDRLVFIGASILILPCLTVAALAASATGAMDAAVPVDVHRAPADIGHTPPSMLPIVVVRAESPVESDVRSATSLLQNTSNPKRRARIFQELYHRLSVEADQEVRESELAPGSSIAIQYQDNLKELNNKIRNHPNGLVLSKAECHSLESNVVDDWTNGSGNTNELPPSATASLKVISAYCGTPGLDTTVMAEYGVKK